MSLAAPSVNLTPIRLRMRPDLTFTRQHWQGVEYWVIKEPLGQKYYQFPPQVFFLLQQLDGYRSAQQILDNYHEEFSPRRLSQEQLHNLLQRFHKDSLVISDSSGQGSELLKRGRKARAMERLQTFSNILAVRFRGVDPERLLNRMNRWTWWLFTKPVGALAGMAALVALLSVVINWTEFTSRLPGFDQFFDIRRWLMFVVVVGLSKIIHEFGHGLSCKRFGGECHEIGFMLLVMTPCLYCNVSDSWRLTNKWHRVVIGAAGMYFEIIIATIATFIWWFATQGFIQDICLQFMLVASVSTVIFNGNPLLRFDGYYILSDILEIPNLQQKSTKSLTTLMGRHWLGLEMPDDPLLPKNRMVSFAMFTVAAFLYRWFILISILLFLTRWLQPYGLESVGRGIAWFAAIGMFVWPGYRLFKYFAVPGKIMQIKPKRFSVGLLIVTSVLGMVLLIPWPHYLRCRVIVIPELLETVYAQETGTLVKLDVRPGMVVEKGQLLGTLENERLDRSIARNSAELAQARQRRMQILQTGPLRPEMISQMALVPSLDAEIVRLEEIGRIQEQQRDMLELRSSMDGVVLATPFNIQLPGKVETPLLDSSPVLGNVQYRPTLNRGDRFCEVAATDQWQGVVLLDEQQIRFVQENQRIWIRLNASPGHMIESGLTVIGVSDQLAGRENRNESPDGIQMRSRLPDLVSEFVSPSKQNTIQYYALTRIPAEESREFRIGMDGHCRIHTGNRNLWQRLRWWFNQNFGT